VTDDEESILGKQVKDKITGLVGIATARCFYIHGCDHIGIQPPADNKTGRVPPLVWSDSPQVEIIGRSIKEKKPKKRPVKVQRRTGGPGDHPPSRAHPSIDTSGYGGENQFLNE